ncbi:MAG: family 16 glycoside hydrolase [Anaerolineales bacterium]
MNSCLFRPRSRTLHRIAFVFAVGSLLLVLLLVMAACAPMTADEAWVEDFEDADDGWQLSSDAAADLTIEGGRLFIHILQPGQIAWATSERSFRDFDLSVEATQVAGPVDNEYGVFVRMEGDERFYAFSISGDGYVRAAEHDNGSWSLLGSDWTLHEAVNQGEATNLLEVRARGSDFVFRVNETEVAAFSADGLRKGSIGLYAGAFDTPGVRVSFDNLKVVPAP